MKRVALVTGGSGGIGSAIVDALSHQGIIVALHYSSNEANALKVRNGRENIFLFQCDFASPQLDLIERVVQQLGAVDYLINCAGIMANESLFDMDAKAFDALFAINTRTPYLLAAEAFELMKAQRYGRIINISSFTVKFGMGRNSSVHYAASKAALEALTTGLSRLGAEHNVLVNTIRPGLIASDMQKDRPGLQNRISMIPVKRIGQPEEIADMIAFLCSDKGSFITGQTITIAGGE